MSGRLLTPRLRPRWVPCLFLLLMVAGLPAHGAPSADPEIRIDPTTLHFGAAAFSATSAKSLEASPPAVSRQAVPEAIRQKAAQGRPVRVLVQLNASFRPEGRLSRSQALDQRQAISRVQDSVLGKLAGQRFKLHA